MSRTRPAPCRIALLILFCALPGLTGCRDRDIRTYRTPKDAEGDAQPPFSGHRADSAPPSLQWRAPDAWKAQPAAGMRIASYLVSGPGAGSADISIVSFAGSGGDELANINRWRNQLKLAPVAAEDLKAQLQEIAAPAGGIAVADLASGEAENGRPPARILGAWLRLEERVWFFKMMGPAELVGSQKDSFIEFLRSVALAAPAAESRPPLAEPGAAPSNTNDLPRTALEAPELGSRRPGPLASGPARPAAGSSLRWEAPGSWGVRPASSMRRGSYSLGPDGGVELAITAFPGDVGGTLANVNRWMGQVGLAPVEEAELGHVATLLDANGLNFVVVDTGAKDPLRPQRIVAAMVAWQGSTWFFKLNGPGELVEREKPGFLRFLQTVRPP